MVVVLCSRSQVKADFGWLGVIVLPGMVWRKVCDAHQQGPAYHLVLWGPLPSCPL